MRRGRDASAPSTTGTMRWREGRVNRDDETREVLARLQRLYGFFGERGAPFGVGEEVLAGRGQDRAACRALEDLGTHDPLEMPDAIRDGGLRDDQLRPRRAPKLPLAHDREEHFEIAEIQSHKQRL